MTSTKFVLDKKITSCISKVGQSLSFLCKKVLKYRNIKLATKTKVYMAVVPTSLLYGCKTLYTVHKAPETTCVV